MTLVVFELSMPKNNSWNGKWSGDGNPYNIVKKLTKRGAERVLKNSNYGYVFGDGWIANIHVRKVSAQEAIRLRKQSLGFCGYQWMVNNICLYGNTEGKI